MTITAIVLSKSGIVPQKTLDSIAFADEIFVIVDSDSKEKPSIKSGIKYFNRPLAGDFSGQRNYAISKAHTKWILFIDDDEYVSSELALEIKARIRSGTVKGYYIPRRDVVFHDELKHGETGDLKILRLAQKGAGEFCRTVHEKWEINGLIADLESPLYHIKDNFVSEFSSRIALYGPKDALALESENKPFSFFRLLFYPKAKFFQNYFIRLGFLDGLPGLFLAYLLAVQSLSVRVFQWTKEG